MHTESATNRAMLTTCHKPQSCECNIDYIIRYIDTREIYTYCNSSTEMSRELKNLNKLAGFKRFIAETRVN
jgi:hypothetical protein